MIKILELFGGIGTFRKALENLDINIKSIDYVEILMYAVKAYNVMFDNGYKPQNVIEWNMNVNILFHGSPCQDFSKAGLNNINTGRSILYERTLEIIEFELNKKPEIVIWENVPNLISKLHIHHFKHYCETMNRLGYTTTYKVLKATGYGSAQARDRLYVVSIYGDKEFVFPTPNINVPNICDYIDFNVSFKDYELSENEKKLFFYEKEELYVREATTVGYKLVEEFDTVNVEFPNSKTRRGRVGKKVCPTITTHPRIAIYYNKKLRMLTALEHWRFMGYKDDDYFKLKQIGLKDSQISFLAGNSICVSVLESLILALFEQGFLNGKDFENKQKEEIYENKKSDQQ